jgi:hypothetical protein
MPQRNRSLFTRGRVLGALLAVALVMTAVSYLQDGVFDWRGLVANLSTELIGAVLTYLVLEQVIGRREEQEQHKEHLIRELENPNNGIVAEAVNELRAHGWLTDGSLAGWLIVGGNFHGLYLKDANLMGMGMYKCTLRDAQIEQSQLLTLSDLRRTTLPDGSRYDGRFCLRGDIAWAQMHYSLDAQKATDAQMAEYYDVPLEAYLAGKAWARAHLERLTGHCPEWVRMTDESP